MSNNTGVQEPDDFVENDPFDPEVVARYEEQAAEQDEVEVDKVREMLGRRKQAYAEVFTEGPTSQAALNIVIADLMWFCKDRQSSYDVRDGIHADTLMKIKDGRREVFQRIKNFSRLDSDALLLMYTDATTKPK